MDVYPRDKVEVKFDWIEGIGVVVVELSEITRGSLVSSAVWYPNGAFDKALWYVSLSALCKEVGFNHRGE